MIRDAATDTPQSLNGLTGRRYLTELGLALAAYILVLTGSLALVEGGMVTGGARTAVTLAPVIPAVVMAWVILRQFRRMDELQRRVQFEALAFAFVGTALFSVTYGFLELAGFPKLPMFVVWPVMGGLWGLGAWLASRRFR